MLKQSLEKIYDHRSSNSLSAKLRAKRQNFFKSLVLSIATQQNRVKILDVGGVPEFWKESEFFKEITVDVEIYIVNIEPSYEKYGNIDPKIQVITGDARNMKNFKDKEFDIVFSNSVIEHVGDYNDQRQMANEVMRIGKRYFIQTPNLFFPIEPHFVFPLFQFLPIELRVKLLNNFTLGWSKKEPDRQKARSIVKSIRLLTKKEFVNLFPQAKLYEEKLWGLTKSFIVYRGW